MIDQGPYLQHKLSAFPTASVACLPAPRAGKAEAEQKREHGVCSRFLHSSLHSNVFRVSTSERTTKYYMKIIPIMALHNY